MGGVECCCERESMAQKFERERKKKDDAADERQQVRINDEANVDISTEVVKEKSQRNMDELEKFEALLPFDNIMIGGFFAIVQEVEENNEGYVMYDKFVAKISEENPEWKATLSEGRDSLTAKVLLSKFM